MRQLSMTEEYINQVLDDVRKQIENAKFSTDKITYNISLSREKLSGDDRVQVHFSEAAYYKMKELIDQSSKEIGWDGIVHRDTENKRIFYIDDIIVYPQTVTTSTVNTDDEKYSVWLMGLDDDTFNHRRFNGHSHVNMGTAPSGVDMTYREQSMKNINDFFIFGIFNKRGESNMAVYDVENNALYENDDVILYLPMPDYTDWAKSAIKDNVAEHTYAPAYGTYGNYGNYGGYAAPAGGYNQIGKKDTGVQGASNKASKDTNERNAYLSDAEYESYWDSYYGNGGMYE